MVVLAYLKQKWKELTYYTSEIDLTFLILRLLTLGGGLVWLEVAPLSLVEQTMFANVLVFFSCYSLIFYGLIYLKPKWLRGVYSASLFLDLSLITYLIHAEPHLENSFFICFYLLICLHTIYFGLQFGLLVASLSGLLYFIGIFHHLNEYSYMTLALRIAFFFLIAVPAGLLSERIKREKETVEVLNTELARSLQNLKQTQAKLIEAEKLSALGRQTACLTHEIRNPLMAVGGFARRLEKRLSEGSTEKVYASVITREVLRLENILLDTLIYNNTREPELARNDINKPVEDAIALYSDMCLENNIIVSQDLDKQLPLVKINPQHVQQALDNLISNSMQAMPDGGMIDIITGQEKRNNTSFLSITIRDTGDGIEPEILDYIFEPFYSTNKTRLGTGLGLSIVKQIIDEHHGFIEVDSLIGQGTTFTLLFPYQSEEQDRMLPCWEYLGCGIEANSTRRCGAYPHFGRICWSTVGTFSAKKSEGICAQKLDNCENCAFYKTVNNDEPMSSFVSYESIH